MHTSKHLRICVIGAGTAGLATAIAMAVKGFEVHVFEKHQSLTDLGAGLLIQPQGIRALGQLGVGAQFQRASVPVDRLHGVTHRGWTLVDVPYADGEARAVSRSALSKLLYEAAVSAGARVHFSAEVSGIVVRGERAEIAGVGTSSLFDLVVIADGASAGLAEQCGLVASPQLYPWGALWGLFPVKDWKYSRVLEQRYRTTEQMFGLMPTRQEGDVTYLSLFWSLRNDRYSAWREAPVDDWKRELLSLWPEALPIIEQIHSHDQMSFATYRQARALSLASGPLCVVGDAAHSMSPQLGLGSTLAVQDALMLATQVDEHGARLGAWSYGRHRRLSVKAYQFLSRALTPCFQAQGSGLWRDLLFAAGVRTPGVKYLMYRSVAEPRGVTRCRDSKLESSRGR